MAMNAALTIEHIAQPGFRAITCSSTYLGIGLGSLRRLGEAPEQ